MPVRDPKSVSSGAGKVIFEDTFSGKASELWHFSGTPWLVISGEFYPLDLPARGMASAWIDLTSLGNAEIQMDVRIPRRCKDSFSVGITGERESVSLAVGSSSGCLMWQRGGEAQATELQVKRLEIGREQTHSVRLKQHDGNFTADFNGQTWAIPFSGFAGRLQFTIVAPYGTTSNDDRIRLKRVVVSNASGTKPPPPPESIAPFVVDPRDLEKLAENLRLKVDNGKAKDIVASGKIALATFDMINFSSRDVVRDVGEDLSTSMISNGFNLIERAQLDKVLQELKIQDSGLIDSKTAQQIGKLIGCDLIMVGSISDREDYVVINCRLLQTSTGTAIVAQKQEMRKILRR